MSPCLSGALGVIGSSPSDSADKLAGGRPVRPLGEGSAVTKLAAITPSYAKRFEPCRDLTPSALAHSPAVTVHHISAPGRDMGLFSVWRGPRTQVWSVDQLLSRYLLGVPGVDFWLNLSRPVPRVRGCVMQQVVKLQAAARSEADILLLLDSDLLFVRPVTAETFRRHGLLHVCRKDAGVDEILPRHLVWHDVARDLLGIPHAQRPLLDCVSAFNVWDRRAVLAMRDRIQQVTGRSRLGAVARRRMALSRL
jgi:Family of unknown function (DUF6492)